jgi:hypothetical protein
MIGMERIYRDIMDGMASTIVFSVRSFAILLRLLAEIPVISSRSA